MEKIDYKELATKLFCWLILGISAILFVKYLFGYTVPFLVAWGIAYLIYPIAHKLSAKTKLPRKVCSFVLVLLLLTVILLLLFLIVNRLAYEIQNFVEYMTSHSEDIANYFGVIFDFISSIGDKLPIINQFQDPGLIESITQNVNAFISSVWKSLLDALGTAIPNFAADIVTTLPNILFVSLITVISCFYFAMDVDLLHIKLKGMLPENLIRYIRRVKKRISYGLRKYFKAYFIIFGITFAELFIGFLILGIEYSFVLALLISFIDFLPVFGTGAVLLPWGVILLFMNKYFLGIGIIILLLIITVVRQVVEPKIVGKSLGVHPIITLVTIYIGFKLFGFFGMLFLPLATILLLSKEAKEEVE